MHLAAATVLNVTPDHLDRYADVAPYCGGQGAHLARLRCRRHSISTIRWWPPWSVPVAGS